MELNANRQNLTCMLCSYFSQLDRGIGMFLWMDILGSGGTKEQVPLNLFPPSPMGWFWFTLEQSQKSQWLFSCNSLWTESSQAQSDHRNKSVGFKFVGLHASASIPKSMRRVHNLLALAVRVYVREKKRQLCNQTELAYLWRALFHVAQATITKYHRLCKGNKRHLFSHSPGGWTSRIKVSAGLVPAWTFLLGWEVATFSPCSHMVFLQCVHLCVCLSLIFWGHNHITWMSNDLILT